MAGAVMTRILLTRLAQIALTLAILSVCAFALIALMPGDPIEVAIAGDPRLTGGGPPRMSHASAIAMLADAAAASQGGDGWIIGGFVLLGAALVVGFAELFVPTTGLLALVTGACAVGSVVCFFMHGATWGFAALLAYAAGAPVLVMVGLKVWTRSPLARRMALGEGSEIRGDRAGRAQRDRGRGRHRGDAAAAGGLHPRRRTPDRGVRGARDDRGRHARHRRRGLRRGRARAGARLTSVPCT